MADLDFWTERLRRFGHTGWADPAIYAYDQRLRLRAVRQWLRAREGAHRRALDFGCGVGDFSALLAEFHPGVVGYDIAPAILERSRSRISSPRVRFTADRAEALAGGPYDVVLCITVFQHVLDDGEARTLAAGLAAAMAEGGSLLMLETMVPAPQAVAVQRAGYLRQRSETELQGLFEAAGLRFTACRAFHHPLQAPTPAFARYHGSLQVRALRRLAAAGAGFAARRLDAIAERAVAADDPSESSGLGPTRFLEFTRTGDLPHGRA